MGGRIAEQIIYGEDEISSGASSDLAQATAVAREMVMRWGMSELGPMTVGNEKEWDYLSPEIKNLLDGQVKKLLDDSYARVLKYMTEHKSNLNYLAEALVEHKTINHEEVVLALSGKDIKPLVDKRKAEEEAMKEVEKQKYEAVDENAVVVPAQPRIPQRPQIPPRNIPSKEKL